jgi:isovaleryl-CoA dehydrogenase
MLGLTVPEEYGGAGFINATAVAIVHEELSYRDPAFCLSYLAHSVLFCNNLAVNGSRDQVSLYVWIVCLTLDGAALVNCVVYLFIACQVHARSV